MKNLIPIILLFSIIITSCSTPEIQEDYIFACNADEDCPSSDMYCINYPALRLYHLADSNKYGNPLLISNYESDGNSHWGVCISDSKLEQSSNIESCFNNRLDSLALLESLYNKTSNSTINITSNSTAILTDLVDCNNPQCAIFEKCQNQDTYAKDFLNQLFKTCTYTYNSSKEKFPFSSENCPAGLGICIPLNQNFSDTIGEGICLPLCSTKGPIKTTFSEFDLDIYEFTQYISTLIDKNNSSFKISQNADFLKCRQAVLTSTTETSSSVIVDVVFPSDIQTTCTSDASKITYEVQLPELQNKETISFCYKSTNTNSK